MSDRNDIIALRILTRAREDFQAQRKRMDNRIGRKADGTAQDIDERQMRQDDAEAISAISDAAKEQEEQIEKKLNKVLKRFPVYTEFLKNVKGVGTIAAATIISTFDIEKATTVSKMWQYAGLNPGLVKGKKRKDKADGSFDIIVTDTMIRGDRMTPGFVAPFNKKLRTALCGVLADGFIKAGFRWVPVIEEEWNHLPDNIKDRRDKKIDGKMVKDCPVRLEISCPYCQHYYNYKNRLAASEKPVSEIRSKGKEAEQIAWKDAKPAHRDRAAKRYMIKMFVQDLYNAWRMIEGLPVRPPYQEEYLGHKHG